MAGQAVIGVSMEGKKRKRNLDFDDQNDPGEKRKKSTNLQTRKVTTPANKRKNLQQVKNNTTPAPISKFLSRFNFRKKESSIELPHNSRFKESENEENKKFKK